MSCRHTSHRRLQIRLLDLRLFEGVPPFKTLPRVATLRTGSGIVTPDTPRMVPLVAAAEHPSRTQPKRAPLETASGLAGPDTSRVYA